MVRVSRITGPAFLALGLGVLGCGPFEDCWILPIQPVDEARDCLHPMTAAGVRTCIAPGQPPGPGLVPVCLVDERGHLFRTWVNATDRLEGAGWTHSELPQAPSTLSPQDERRCAQAPPAAPDLASTCR